MNINTLGEIKNDVEVGNLQNATPRKNMVDDILIDIRPSKGLGTKTLAYVNIMIPLDNYVRLKINSFRIMADSYSKVGPGYRLVPPAILAGSKYKEIVFFEGDKEFWFSLQNKVLSEYESKILSEEMN